MKKIWAHTLVRNEERWLWYSVKSVINFVDKVLLWDMESTDSTFKICRELKKRYPTKIIFKEIKETDPKGFARVRQQMLDATKSDWFLVVDGDEIWWKDSIQKVTKEIQSSNSNKYESIVVPMIYPIGDIFHLQDQSAGRYKLAGKTGNYSLRAINKKIPGLSSQKPHGTWGWTDGDGKMIQDRDEAKILFVDAPYIHTSFLPRGGALDDDKKVIKRKNKLKYEIGTTFPMDYYYPEVFFQFRPDFVPSPWNKAGNKYLIKSALQTPLKKIKRSLIKNKVGY
jgi:hypothetical protein